MWYKELEDGIQKMKEELLKSRSKRIQSQLKELKEYGGEEKFDFFLDQGVRNLAIHYLINDGQEDNNDLAVNVLHGLVNFVKAAETTLYFRVDLEGYGTQVYRKIAVSAHSSLADLAYLTILAFGGYGNHLFTFTLDKYDFYDKLFFDNEDYPLAEDYMLYDIDFADIKNMKLIYDMGEDWTFKFRQLKKGKENFEEYPYGYVFEGKGPNIWEDNRQLFEMYLENPKLNLIDYIGEDITIEEYVNECDEMKPFDLEECNDGLDMFEFIRNYRQKSNF